MLTDLHLLHNLPQTRTIPSTILSNNSHFLGTPGLITPHTTHNKTLKIHLSVHGELSIPFPSLPSNLYIALARPNHSSPYLCHVTDTSTQASWPSTPDESCGDSTIRNRRAAFDSASVLLAPLCVLVEALGVGARIGNANGQKPAPNSTSNIKGPCVAAKIN